MSFYAQKKRTDSNDKNFYFGATSKDLANTARKFK